MPDTCIYRMNQLVAMITIEKAPGKKYGRVEKAQAYIDALYDADVIKFPEWNEWTEKIMSAYSFSV